MNDKLFNRVDDFNSITGELSSTSLGTVISFARRHLEAENFKVILSKLLKLLSQDSTYSTGELLKSYDKIRRAYDQHLSQLTPKEILWCLCWAKRLSSESSKGYSAAVDTSKLSYSSKSQQSTDERLMVLQQLAVANPAPASPVEALIKPKEEKSSLQPNSNVTAKVTEITNKITFAELDGCHLEFPTPNYPQYKVGDKVKLKIKNAKSTNSYNAIFKG